MIDTANHLQDTIVTSICDSLTVVNGKTQQVILIEKKKENTKSIMDNPFYTSFLFPLLVAALVAIIAHLISRRKERSEIEKLTVETEQLKRAFEPYVLSTMHEIQKELFKPKIEGLKQLAMIFRDFFQYDNPYEKGEPVTTELEDYYQAIMSNFGRHGFDKFSSFIDNYKHYYPQKVHDEINTVETLIHEMYESYKSKASLMNNELTKRDFDVLYNLPINFTILINAIRKDLKLDSTYIDDFLEKYKTH